MSELSSIPPGSSGTLVSGEEAKAVQKLSDFGTTVIQEGGQLARYVGRVLGTVPEDLVGLVLGDPLRFVRTVIAGQYDEILTRIFRDRNVTPQAVSPSLAIPLLRAAYDESRPELQELWARLIAAAMDPARSARVRRSFVDTLQRFDPLDALVLKQRHDVSGSPSPNARDYLASHLQVPSQEIEISTQNLRDLKCVQINNNDYANFYMTPYGNGLLRACSD